VKEDIMDDAISAGRRRFLGAAGMTIAAAGFGAFEVGAAQPRAKLIWQTASPRWRFDDATFERTAKAFDNPDHVSIVIHNDRWRLGLADGEPKYDDLEKQLAAGPLITVPTITLEGDANGAPHPDPGSYAKKFAGKYKHRLLNGGVGHNLPQEVPRHFADAIIESDWF
jgi:hypothetical protein